MPFKRLPDAAQQQQQQPRQQIVINMCITGRHWWRLHTVPCPICQLRYVSSMATISAHPMANMSSGEEESNLHYIRLFNPPPSPFRYELSNGDTRYERTYWLPVGKGRVLARRGFYSVPLPNSQYSTVYYRADHQGYHVETSKYASVCVPDRA